MPSLAQPCPPRAMSAASVSEHGKYECFARVRDVYRQAYLSKLRAFDLPAGGTLHASHAAVLDAVAEQLNANTPKRPAAFALAALERFPQLARRDGTVYSADEVDENLQAAHVVVETLANALVEARPEDATAFLRERARALAQDEARKDDASSLEVPMWMLSASELREAIVRVFKKFDVDKNGVLDRKELKALLSSADLRISKHIVTEVLVEADENEDGLISFDEFLPLMVDVIAAQQAKEKARASRESDAVRRLEVAHDQVVKGMTRQRLEDTMRGVFRSFDEDGNGVLSRKEFKKCLKASKLGFTRKEVNLLLSAVDENDDGTISYEEFVPICFVVLVERRAEMLAEEEALTSSDGLTQLLVEYFSALDKDRAGHISRRDVSRALTHFSDDYGLGLSKAQVAAVASEAEPAGGGIGVRYISFAPLAARMIDELDGNSGRKAQLEAASVLSESAGAQYIQGLSHDEVVDILRRAFVMVDTDNNGVLTIDEMEHMLRLMTTADGSKFELSDGEVDAIVSACDANGDGVVEYAELETFIFDVLHHIQSKKDIDWRTKMNTAAAVDALPSAPSSSG